MSKKHIHIVLGCPSTIWIRKPLESSRKVYNRANTSLNKHFDVLPYRMRMGDGGTNSKYGDGGVSGAGMKNYYKYFTKVM